MGTESLIIVCVKCVCEFTSENQDAPLSKIPKEDFLGELFCCLSDCESEWADVVRLNAQGLHEILILVHFRDLNSTEHYSNGE